MHSGSILCILLSASLCFAHPLDYEVLRSIQARSLSAFPTSSAAPASTTTARAGMTPFDLADMLKGNQKFVEQKSELRTVLSETPGVMFIGCSDNRLSPDAIFQIQTGSTISHSNLGNQFTGKDPSADAAVANAVNNIGVQHIIVLGHYGCQSVHTAMATKMDTIAQKWLQPITDIFFRSRRPEIKKLLNARRWHDKEGATQATKYAFRALIEENVKATVKMIRRESVLSIAYNKKSKKDTLNVFVYGLVLDEETGEVKDLGVSFGPPGQTIPKLPLEAIVIEKQHNSFGKFKPKAKKLDPTVTSTAARSTTSSSPTTSETL